MAWRQLRTSAAAAGAVLVAVVLLLTVTGVHLNHLYSAYRSCTGFNCDSAHFQLDRSYHHVKLIGTLLVGVPAVLGIFWGAPLVSREIENGTYRLAWTQSVTRTRWISTRIAVGALAAVICAGLLTFAFTWWSIPYDRTGTDRIVPAVFDERGVVAVGYALFAFALGVAAGALLRRTLAAMAVTLAGFIAVRMVVQFFVREHLVTPLTRVVALTQRTSLSFLRTPTSMTISPHSSGSVPHAWTLGAKLVDSSGHAPSQAFLSRVCSGMLHVQPPPHLAGRTVTSPTPQMTAAVNTCIDNVAQRFHLVVSYQPASRFWELQWLELAVFAGLAVMLLGVAVYCVRRLGSGW